MTKRNTHQQRGKSADQRFFEKVRKTDHCWEWDSAKQGAGYGVFWVDSKVKSVNAHRFSWELANKACIPAGMVVMHSCNNKGCVNPAHLSLGTAKENAIAASRDGLAPRGERNGGGRKLSEDDVREILRTKDVAGCWVTAAKFNVSTQTVKAIRRGEIWKHVGSGDASI